MPIKYPYHWQPYPTMPVYPLKNYYSELKSAAPPFYPVQSGTNDNVIVVVLDESSSMGSCFEQTCSGFDEFVLTQKNADSAKIGKAFMTLITFNGSEYRTRFENKPIHEVPKLKTVYQPNGMTNLLDAIGGAMVKVNDTLTNIPLAFRPGVTIVIFTDGQENQSRIYNNDDIRKMVQDAEKAEWTFTFFGANIDAFAVGSAFGMNSFNTVQYDTNNMGSTFTVASASMLSTRSAKSAGLTTHDIYKTMYSAEDREKVK